MLIGLVDTTALSPMMVFTLDPRLETMGSLPGSIRKMIYEKENEVPHTGKSLAGSGAGFF